MEKHALQDELDVLEKVSRMALLNADDRDIVALSLSRIRDILRRITIVNQPQSTPIDQPQLAPGTPGTDANTAS